MTYSDRRVGAAIRRRRIRLGMEVAAVLLGFTAATELFAWSSSGVVVAAGIPLGVTPLFAVASTMWFPKQSGVLGWACTLLSGAAVLVASACPPIADVPGAQAVGLAVVAAGMFAIAVLRGGYYTAILAETRTLGPLGIRVAPKSAVDDSTDAS